MAATGPKNITEKALRAALRKHAGIPVLAARELGCDRSNVAHRIARSPALQALVAEIEAEVDDMTDGVIIDTLGRRDGAGRPTKDAQNMARWRKDHKLRAEGFRLRLEHTGKDGVPLPAAPSVQVQIVYVGDGAQPGAETEDVI